MSNLLSRDALLKGDVLKIEKVELSTGHVYVREMTAKEKGIWEASLMKEKPNADPNKPAEYEVSLDDFKAKLAVVTVCDKDGELLFKPTDYKVLSSKLSASNMELIVDKAQELNSVTKKDKEEILKNSEADLSGNSSSGSAEN